MNQKTKSYMKNCIQNALLWENKLLSIQGNGNVGWSDVLNPASVGIALDDIGYGQNQLLQLGALHVFRKRDEILSNDGQLVMDELYFNRILQRCLFISPWESLRHGDLPFDTAGFFNGEDIPGWDTWIFHALFDKEKAPRIEGTVFDYMLFVLVPENYIELIREILSTIYAPHVCLAEEFPIDELNFEHASFVAP